MLNLDRLSKITFPFNPPDGGLLNLWFELSQEIHIESRKVTSFPVLFGDISGLKDFFNFLIVFVIGSSQTKMYHYNLLKTFFRYDNTRQIEGSKNDASVSPTDLVKGRKQFNNLDIGLFDKTKLALSSFCLSKRLQRRKDVFKKGLGLLENALDTQTIIRYQRALRILMSL